MKNSATPTGTPEELSQQWKDLVRRASRDELSGLLNRATLEQAIRNRLASRSADEPCALIIIDLDNFKQVNDTLGHQAGDQAIRDSARLLSGMFRASDITGRLGGDEFAVFLTGADLDETVLTRKAAEVCETLQLSLGNNGTITLTASAGICLGHGGQSFEALYQTADLALYKAKRAGRRRFCLQAGDRTPGSGAEAAVPVGAIPLNSLLESMASGVSLLEMGEEPRLIYVSPSFCHLIGADPGSYTLPRTLAGLVHPDDLPALFETLRRGLSTGEAIEFTSRICSADGKRWLWCHSRAVRIVYDNPNPVLLVTGIDVSAYKESEHRLEISNQRLQAAFDQVAQPLWEVDLATRVFTLYRPGHSEADCALAFPDQLLEDGMIHAGSAAAFRRFAQELLSGQAQGFGNFVFRLGGSECYRWASLSYQMIFDDAGRALRAVGVAEDLSCTFERHNPGRSFRGLMPTALLADLVVEMRLDLTQDAIDELWTEGKDLTNEYAQVSCTELLRNRKESFRRDNCRSGEDDFPTCFSPARMRALFKEGRRWLTAVYRRADVGGNIHRVRQVLRLREDPFTHNIQAVGCILQLHLPPAWEQVLVSLAAPCDPVTRLHTRATAEQAGRAFDKAGAAPYAVAVFQCVGLTAAPEDALHPVQRTRRGLAAALSAAMGGDCLLTQYAQDQILIFFPHLLAREELQRRFSEAFEFLRLVLTDVLPLQTLRFVVAIAQRNTPDESSAQLINQALCRCAMSQNAATDTVTFARRDENQSWAQLNSPRRQGDEVAVRAVEDGKALSESGREVAFRCISGMLAADSLEASVQQTLHNIGAYYDADRAYLLTLARHDQIVTMPFEWCAPTKSSIQQAVSGSQLHRFPLLERCLREQAPVFLTRRGSQAAGHTAPSAAPPSPWHYAAFPLMEEGRITGFLCVENARNTPADSALIGTLLPYLLREPGRFRRSGGISGQVGHLMDAPDLRSYMGAIYTLNAGRYSSLGAACLAISGMENPRNMGYEYASKLLWYVSKSLTDVFGASLLFRTGEAEFVAFLPNTTRQVFLAKFGRLRSMLQRRYPREIRLGCAWAEEDFTGKKLADIARQNMALEQSAPPSVLPPGLLGETGGLHLSDGHTAVVYYQPKMDLHTGTLVGAEALVRGVTASGQVIPPAEFLPALEESAAIRDLDLFVLERTLDQMDRWRRSGYGVVPVSVNLSRVTLLYSSILAAILAVQSRYPDLPEGSLEVEITEHADTLETDVIRSLIEWLRGFGIRVSLDDFGSRYANLSLFTRGNFDTVKLDRSMVADLPDNPVNQMLVRDIVQLCHMRQITCLAEGVETEAQANALRAAGCRYAQGYLYGRAVPAAIFEETYLSARQSEVPGRHGKEDP